MEPYTFCKADHSSYCAFVKSCEIQPTWFEASFMRLVTDGNDAAAAF